jgi:hypothetical protein
MKKNRKNYLFFVFLGNYRNEVIVFTSIYLEHKNSDN